MIVGAILERTAAIAGRRVFGQRVSGRTVARLVGDDRHRRVVEGAKVESGWASMLL